MIEADVEGASVRREAGDDGAFSLTIPGQTGQSISLKLDLPRCGCQSVTLILEVPGRGKRPSPLTHQLLQTWRLPRGVHIGGDAGTTEPGTAILAMAGFQAVCTVADRTGAFELRVFAEPGAPVTLRARRACRPAAPAVSLCAPEVAGLHGLAMTACAGRFQLSGRPGSAPTETITWTNRRHAAGGDRAGRRLETEPPTWRRGGSRERSFGTNPVRRDGRRQPYRAPEERLAAARDRPLRRSGSTCCMRRPVR